MVFDVPLDEVTDVVWPWYYFGGGVKLSVAGERYRFSFVLPNGARVPDGAGGRGRGRPGRARHRVAEGVDIGAGRDVGKEWRRRLEAAGSAVSAAADSPT